jgi:NAD(P)H dehydrogenase (quinone)
MNVRTSRNRLSAETTTATNAVRSLPQAVTDGATLAGAEARLLRVAELAPDSAIAQNPQ